MFVSGDVVGILLVEVMNLFCGVVSVLSEYWFRFVVKFSCVVCI